MYIVGTPPMRVTWSRSMISRALAGSNRGRSVSVAPRRTEAFIMQVCPNTWNSGRRPKTTSPGSSPRIEDEALTSALRPMFA